jgi:hypothetical protein
MKTLKLTSQQYRAWWYWLAWPYIGQPTVLSLVRLHGCTDWPGSILVIKTCHFIVQQVKGHIKEIKPNSLFHPNKGEQSKGYFIQRLEKLYNTF